MINRKTPVAREIPFDPGSSGLASLNVNDAIIEAKNFNPQVSTAAFYDDFDGRATWSPSTSNSGTASVGGGNAALVSGKHLGVSLLQLGTSAISTAGLIQSGTLANNTVFGNGAASYKALIYILNLATDSQNYTYRIGYGTSTTVDHADGVYFEYDHANSDNWRLKTASNSVRTVTTSSIAVAQAQWISLSFEVNAAGTQVDFYVNGVLAGSNTTNIPVTTGRGCGPCFQLLATVGAGANRIVYQDYIWFLKQFTARD